MTHYRLLVSGSRDWPDTPEGRSVVRSALIEAAETLTSPTPDGTWPGITLVHGDARGFDRTAARIARELGMRVEAHRPDYRQDGARAPLARDQRMVDAGADTCVAGPLGGTWSGTRYTMKLATAAGIPITEVALPGGGN